MNQTRFRQLLAIGLGNIVSGMLFGTGCLIVEHADNSWWSAENVAEEETTPPKKIVKSTNIGSMSSSNLALSEQEIFKLRQSLDSH
jgi:hypothetical protein